MSVEELGCPNCGGPMPAEAAGSTMGRPPQDVTEVLRWTGEPLATKEVAVVCDIGDLSIGGAARITTQITSNGLTFINGTASAVSKESDYAPANNRASITLQRSGPTIHIHPPGTPV